MAISYPYLPKSREICYVPADNRFMLEAQALAEYYRGQLKQPNGVVIAKDKTVIGLGSIGMNYHRTNGCDRIKHNVPTGVGYDLCPGCSYENHGEVTAIKDAQAQGHDPSGADLFLWGHWWCCEPCWKAMIAAGIKDVYLLENSEVLFNKENPGNIIGKQFG